MSIRPTTRVKNWFTGPGDELAPVPKWLSPTIGGFTIAIDLVVLFAMAWYAWQFSAEANYAVLALISCVIYVILLIVAVTSMILSLAKFTDSPLSREVIDGRSFIPRYFARAEVLCFFALTTILVIALI